MKAATYLVTDPGLCGPRGVVPTVRAAVSGGVTCVQVRDKRASARDLLATVRAVADAVGDRCTVLVDDRLDVALAARNNGAHVHGVHLGQSDLPVRTARELLGPDAVIGLTAHTPEHLVDIAALPAGTVDYLGVGVIRPTATKPDHPRPLGVPGFAAIARATAVPCVAIGGIRVSDVAALQDAGAAGVAVVSAICAADDPRAAAAAFAQAWA